MNAVKTALRMETDAIKFYKDAADKTTNPVGRKMFLSITEDEKRHLDILAGILKGLDLPKTEISPMENIKTVFRTMKNEMIHRIEATPDELEAFRIAMQMEKEGVEFYRKAESGAETTKEKSLFNRLISEEDQHYNIFANTYSILSDSGNWFMWEEHSMADGGTPWA